MKKLLTFLFVLYGVSLSAQVKIGENVTTIGSSSILELESTNKAFVLTRVATTGSITNPVDGMMVYDLSQNCVRIYQADAWTDCVALSANNSILIQIGNEGDNPNVIPSIVTVAQLVQLPVTGVINENETLYQAYIDANPNLFSAPATVPQVQAMITAVNTAQTTSGGTGLTASYTCSTASAGSMNVAVPVSGVTQTITATVTTLGSYNISATANGVTFAASGTFTATGAQEIVMTATGTPIAAGTHSFTLNTTPNCSFDRTTSWAPAVVSGYVCSTASAGTMTEGEAVSGVTQTITATVTSAGAYTISTTTENGVTFAASGIFSTAGSHQVVLTASGTPTSYGTNTFTLTTTPNCSFDRNTSFKPLPAGITLHNADNYFIVSVFDQDYSPYATPTTAGSIATAQAADGVSDATQDYQGILTTTGIAVRIFLTTTTTVNLPAFSQTITIPASYTEDGISRDIIFSYSATTVQSTATRIFGNVKALGGDLKIKKLDLQTGIGNDLLGFLLAQFTYASNNAGGVATFDLRALAAIPDRNIADLQHVMFYLPMQGPDNNLWLNNNLGAIYANSGKPSYNPTLQATDNLDIKGFGSLFQWGRYSDGHELANWGINPTFGGSTNVKSPTDTPPDALFIKGSGDFGTDWRTTPNNNLWQGVVGINNPCPLGFRIPTVTEFTNMLNAGSITNAATAESSFMKLPMAGYRSGTVAVHVPHTNGNQTFYHTSNAETTNNTLYTIQITNDAVLSSAVISARARGAAVRCIKD